jgi:crotonobetaine/carnitine-CoA ligase
MADDDIIHDRTIHRVLKQKARQYGGREFFRFQERAFSFEDLDRESDRVAAGFQSLGVVKGDKVAIFMGNRPEFLFLWFGLCKLGAVEVPINTAHRGNLLVYMVDKAHCSMIIVGSVFLDRVAPVLKELPRLEKVVVLGEPGKEVPKLDKPTLDYWQVVNNNGKYEEVDVIWTDPFAIMFTSGTTGPSKGALFPHNYALHMGEVVTRAAEYTEKDCFYCVLPLYHANAQVLSTMPALMDGARMILRERFSASQFWDEVKRYGCTQFNYIGAILPILYKAEPKPDDADNPVRIMLGGGAPMDLFEAIEKRFGLTLIEGYGLSEIGIPLMNTLRERKPSTCGKPLPDYVVRVVDEYGLELKPHQTGELLVRPQKPNSIFLEYYNMPLKTIEAWGGLWFHSGDYLYSDEDGYFHFVDRKKDAIRRRGENISSYEVEKVVNSHPSVLVSAAIAVKSELGDDEVMVCLRLKPGKSLTAEELISYCEDRMAYFMIPRYIRFMAELPKTPTQRVEKYRLREEGVTPDTWDREAEGYKLKR